MIRHRASKNLQRKCFSILQCQFHYFLHKNYTFSRHFRYSSPVHVNINLNDFFSKDFLPSDGCNGMAMTINARSATVKTIDYLAGVAESSDRFHVHKLSPDGRRDSLRG